MKIPQAAWYDTTLLKNLIFQEITSWIVHNDPKKKTAPFRINNLDLRKQMRQGDSYSMVLLITQSFASIATKWRPDLRFYAPNLINNNTTLSPTWVQIEPPPIQLHN